MKEEYKVFNILDMAEAIGEPNLKKLISDFRCPKNEEIQHFARDNAYEFAKKKISVTYLVVDKEDYIAAIFTLAHKAIEIGDGKLSNSKRRKINRYAVLDSASGNYTVSAFLIAQFGKNYEEDVSTKISGNHLMDLTFAVLEKIQHDIGGGVVFLECEDKPELLEFYQNEENGFTAFGERYSISDDTKYIQLFQFF